MRSIKAAWAVVLLSLPVALAAPGCAAASGDSADSTEPDGTSASTASQEATPLQSDDEAIEQSADAPEDAADADDADEDELGQVDQGEGESSDVIRPHGRHCRRACYDRFHDCRTWRHHHYGHQRCRRQLDLCLSFCGHHRY